MKKICYLMLSAAILFAGCQEDKPITPELSIAPESIEATATAGNYPVAVTGNVSWTATAAAPWLSLNPAIGEGNGTITVNVTENTSVETRTGTLTVTAGAIVKTVAVTQAGISTTLDVQPAAIDAAANAGNYTATITSNTAWVAAADAPWLSLTPAAGEGNSTVTINVLENASAEPRTATITLTAGTLSRTIALAQEALPFYAASTQTWTIGNQTWSDFIQIPACDKEDYENNTTEPRCRSYTVSQGIHCFYYNWAYVSQQAAMLCPSPWRVPTTHDFVTLDIALEGNGNVRRESKEWVLAKYIDTWGGIFGGYASPDGVYGDLNEEYGSGSGCYWSATEINEEAAYRMGFGISGNVLPQYDDWKRNGNLLRCVK
jgi:uncharacterized protein (TIGR02145 family)